MYNVRQQAYFVWWIKSRILYDGRWDFAVGNCEMLIFFFFFSINQIDSLLPVGPWPLIIPYLCYPTVNTDADSAVATPKAVITSLINYDMDWSRNVRPGAFEGFGRLSAFSATEFAYVLVWQITGERIATSSLHLSRRLEDARLYDLSFNYIFPNDWTARQTNRVDTRALVRHLSLITKYQNIFWITTFRNSQRHILILRISITFTFPYVQWMKNVWRFRTEIDKRHSLSDVFLLGIDVVELLKHPMDVYMYFNKKGKCNRSRVYVRASM